MLWEILLAIACGVTCGIFTGCCVLCCVAYQPFDIYNRLTPDAVGFPREGLVKKGWKDDTLKRFELMLGPLKSTEEVIKTISKET